MIVKDVMTALPLSVKRNYRNGRNGEVIDYYNMDKEGKEKVKNSVVRTISPVNEREIDVFVHWR